MTGVPSPSERLEAVAPSSARPASSRRRRGRAAPRSGPRAVPPAADRRPRPPRGRRARRTPSCRGRRRCAGQADRARELVVEVDREVVAGRRGVAHGLVVGDRVGDLGERGVAARVESMRRARARRRSGVSTPRKNWSRTARCTSSPSAVARLGADDERRAVRPRSSAIGVARDVERHARLDRTVDDDVLLVVDDALARLRPTATARDAGAIVSQTGTMAKTGPPRHVIGRVGVRAERLLACTS